MELGGEREVRLTVGVVHAGDLLKAASSAVQIQTAFTADSPAKQRKAKDLLSGFGWFVRWQVIQEFSSVALHRFKVPLKPQDLSDYLTLKLWPRCRILPSEVILTKAIAIHSRCGFQLPSPGGSTEGASVFGQ